MTAWESFARLIGLPVRDSEDALYNERAARQFLSRRAFLGTTACMAAGTAFSFAPARRWTMGIDMGDESQSVGYRFADGAIFLVHSPAPSLNGLWTYSRGELIRERAR